MLECRWKERVRTLRTDAAEPLHPAEEHDNVFNKKIDCDVERYFPADDIRACGQDGSNRNVAHAAPIDVRAAHVPRKSKKKKIPHKHGNQRAAVTS